MGLKYAPLSNIKMKERPILFSTEMVQAILQGRKTQTRREVKDKQAIACIEADITNGIQTPCPYGNVGDVLWVRETYTVERSAISKKFVTYYKADCTSTHHPIDEPWKPSIHMPKEACRLKLRITNIKVERLQSISDSNAKAEGVNDTIQVDEFVKLKGLNWIIPRPFGMHQFSFLSLWCKIYGNDSWIDNPWVWVIEFEKIENKTLPKYTIFSGNPCEM